MSNDLVPVETAALVATHGELPLGLPAMSGEMIRMLGWFNERNRGFPMPAVTPALRFEAQSLIGLVRAAAEPKAQGAIRSWLAPINAAVARPLDKTDCMRRIAVIAEALADLPGACFTVATRALVMRSYNWWPSAAEIAVTLAARAEAVRDALRAMEAFARPAPAMAANAIAHDRGTRPESQAERDAIIANFHAKMQGRDVPGTPFKSASSVFDPAKLERLRPEGTK